MRQRPSLAQGTPFPLSAKLELTVRTVRLSRVRRELRVHHTRQGVHLRIQVETVTSLGNDERTSIYNPGNLRGCAVNV